MNNYPDLDIKLKRLIQTCVQTRNYKKLAVVSLVLNSNLVHEIGIRLGIKPIEKNTSNFDNISQYMKLINKTMNHNFKVTLFKEEHLDTIKKIEVQFFKKKAEIPYRLVKEAFVIYYELRKIEVPNVYESLDLKSHPNPIINEMGLYSFFSQGATKKSNDFSNNFNQLILQKIKKKEILLQEQLQEQFNSKNFEDIMYLKRFKNSLSSSGKGKGTTFAIKNIKLKDNIEYQMEVERLVIYALMGACVLFFSIGVILIAETIFFSQLTLVLSPLLILFFGSAVFIILILNYFKKGAVIK
ncbi:MAG: hypothetical protein ACTSRI_04930 [Promethearchaeota archaeon]